MSEPAEQIGLPKGPKGTPSALQKWLSTSAESIGADSALLIVKQGDRKQLMAHVPSELRPNQSIAALSDRVLLEKRVIVREPGAGAGLSERIALQVGVALRIGGRPAAMMFRLQAPAEVDDEQLLTDIADQVLNREEDVVHAGVQHQPIASLASSQTPKATTPTDSSLDSLVSEQGALIDSVALVLDQSSLGQVLHALANGVASQHGCQRVCIGLNSGRRIKVDAVSGVVDFDTRSTLMIDIADAMAETRDAGSTLSIPVATESQVVPQKHASLAEQLKQPALLSVPLVDDERCIGVLFLERDRSFTDIERTQAERLAILIAPLLALKQMEAMGLMLWMKRHTVRFLKTVFGRRYLGFKLGVSLVALLIFASTLHTQMFRVNANAVLEASVQRAVVSSFPSFLTQVNKRAGDLVQRGDVLAQLDSEDLELQRIALVGERDKLSREYRATLAQRDRSNVRVLAAKQSQLQAQIDLVDSQISRAELVAPVDGVVLSGDLSQALGSPIERGQLLFEVASLHDYRLVLHLDETDVGWVTTESRGQLRLRSLADQTFGFHVTAITPVSEPAQGVNTFRVEAELSEFPDSFRPGMEGVAKIDVEPRSLAWIWTHSFVAWVRLKAWKFGGLG